MREHVDKARAFGLHSNIPECCVEFYCAHDSPYVIALNDRRARAHPHKIMYVEYVPCPKCWRRIASNRQPPAAIHKCDLKCIPFLEEHGMHHTIEYLKSLYETY